MPTKAMTNPWISLPRLNPQASLRLFCFPYAGGSALIYRNWQESFPSTIEVCPVQLPGRGGRMKEKPFTALMPLVEALGQALLPFLDKPFAFFGHSMGTLIGYELAQLLRRENSLSPTNLFLSGHSAPQLKQQERLTYNLPEDEFIEVLRRLNGTPTEVLEHPELIRLMLPLLRADFEAVQTYSYTPYPPLDCPITALGGISDTEVPEEAIQAWREQTNGRFSARMFPGDHFFLHTSERQLINVVVQELTMSLYNAFSTS